MGHQDAAAGAQSFGAPQTNRNLLLRELLLPNFRNYAVEVTASPNHAPILELEAQILEIGLVYDLDVLAAFRAHH